MPEVHNKTIHSFSSEDPQFPARNLLETKVTKKWKCKEAGEKSCFVVLKLDQPRVISGIDIGNERSGFIEVFVGNSKQDPPDFKEILLATSFMTIIEAKNGNNPTRVRCFANNALVESVAKQQWDLVKVLCTQPFNNKIQYGLSFITLHTPEVVINDDSPVKTTKPTTVAQSGKVGESDEKKSKFGKFTIRENSDSGSDDEKKKESPFNRWKSSQSNTSSTKSSIKEQVKAKIDENRKRIRMMSDSSDDEAPKPKEKAKPSRNRTSGLVYEDEDDEPNEKLQKKLDKDQERKEKDQKKPKLLTMRDKSPSRSDSKFASFINDDSPSTSSSSTRHKSTPDRSKPSFSSSSSKKSSPKKSPRHEKETKTKPAQPSTKTVTYKPFHKLLEDVVLVFSGYVNPERGTLRQKAIDMGAKYKPDWDSRCTHLICAFDKTPKYRQVKGKAKIVTKRWIEACFDEQKKLPWRRYALDEDDRDEPESEGEIVNEMLKPNTKIVDSDESESDMVVVDRRGKNGNEKSTEVKPVIVIDEEPEADKRSSQDAMDVSTDDELMQKSGNESVLDLTQAESQIFKDKVFYLNEDLPATDVIKLKNQIAGMMGKITDKPRRADYVITDKGRRLPESSTAEVLLSLWVYECYELGAYIPTTRYKPKHL